MNQKSGPPPDLERRMNEYVLGLEAIAKDRSYYRRDVPERIAIARMTDVMVTAFNSSAEITSLIVAFRRFPEARLVWERYLVLHLHEALKSFRNSMSDLSQEAHRLKMTGSTVVDGGAIDAARKQFTLEMEPVLGNDALMSDIKRIRNTAAGHHAADGLTEWILETSERRTARSPWDQSVFVDAAMRYSLAALRAGQMAFRAVDLNQLPPMPTNHVEMAQYQERVAELDEKSPTPEQKKRTHR